MDIDGAHAVAILLAALAVPLIWLGGGLFRDARSNAGRGNASA